MKKLKAVLFWILIIIVDVTATYWWFVHSPHSSWVQDFTFGPQLAFSGSFGLTVLNWFLLRHLYFIVKER